HSYKPAGLCHVSKNRAMLRSFRLVPGLYPDDISCSSLHSLSNTNALYCRAVSGNCSDYLTVRFQITTLQENNYR
ncbi:MAG: hypothetical protein MUO72_11015, partial [Bacteroidales bacterium]|nr:hypothetical protein [Bacteroidales bacterium]